MMGSTLLRLTLLVSGCLLPGSLSAMTPQQRAQLTALTQRTAEAGRLYTGKKPDEAARILAEVQSQLIALLDDRDPALQRAAMPLYQRLARAQELLQRDGVELPRLPSWDELTGKGPATGAPPGSRGAGVSFKDEVAPLLVSACGNCHVTATRGRFSMSSYEVLMRGPAAGRVVFPGSASSSRLVEVIESGDMPRGGGSVSPQQLGLLKRWIEQGARFDGANPAAPLTEFAASSGVTPMAADGPRVQAATGSETVSFARHIAPILKENCNGCHIAGQQASGNLRLDTFEQLIRGGDSGAIVSPPDAAGSLLVRKLTGQASGQRMPAGGRPPLSDDQIQLISTWISEGARFDGPSPNTNIDVVINQAWAAGASHDQLYQRRRERALAAWRRVLPDDQPALVEAGELLLLGNVPEFRLSELIPELQQALETTRKLLSVPGDQPLIRGGLALFVLKSRYDYSEFGRMIEKRELPRQWLGHWRADPLDVYGVLVDESNDQTPLRAVAGQVIAGAYLGSFSEVPAWFAEGVARNQVATQFRRQDQRAAAWTQSLPAAAQRVPNTKAVMDGQLDEETMGIVGMALTSGMLARNQRPRFNSLLAQLRSGKPFGEAMSATFGPPEEFIQGWLGK